MQQQLIESKQSASAVVDSPSQYQRQRLRQEVRQRIQATLQLAKQLPPQECLRIIKDNLLAIQKYCESNAKTFIVVEEIITCDQYELGGCYENGATLFRGPDENASVAICVTQKGSLLHRNDCPWQVYRNAGDVLM
ncbi:MAG: hypothetical protein F6K19_23880 [Cyanothece sp. SIO1E1]|nr:hypothetical protein [Cyanothece sp. SIO1E1]